MTTSDDGPTKKRGRPRRVTQGDFVGLRLSPDLSKSISAWIEAQPQPRLSRSEAIRCLLEHALADGGPRAALSVAQRIARAERKVANIDVPEEPSPQKGVALLRRGKAEAGLAALKANKRNTK